MRTILSSVGVLFLGCFVLPLALTSAKADPLDHWSTNQLAGGPASPDLMAVAYGNGQFVAVGEYDGDDNGFVQTSGDGMSWTLQSKHDFSILDLFDVTFGNNLFVAVGWDFFGGQNIYTSTNGINWAPHTTAMANVFAVAHGNGQFVAVGDGVNLNSSTMSSNNVYFSADGTNWTATDSGVPATATTPLTDVAYGNNQFVAVGGPGYIYPLFNHSGITNNAAGRKVSFCNGFFFIPAGPGTNLMSTDGLSWSPVTNNTAVTFGHVIYAGGNYVAISATNVFSSRDGTNWIHRNLQLPPSGTFADLTSADRNVLVAGVSGPTAFLSDPFVALGFSAGFPPQLTVSGLTNRTYRIEMTTNLSPVNWQTLTNITLTNAPVLWTDPQPTNSQRFYRAVLLP
jgi:hypothetical protein